MVTPFRAAFAQVNGLFQAGRITASAIFTASEESRCRLGIASRIERIIRNRAQDTPFCRMNAHECGVLPGYGTPHSCGSERIAPSETTSTSCVRAVCFQAPHDPVNLSCGPREMKT